MLGSRIPFSMSKNTNLLYFNSLIYSCNMASKKHHILLLVSKMSVKRPGKLRAAIVLSENAL